MSSIDIKFELQSTITVLRNTLEENSIPLIFSFLDEMNWVVLNEE